MRSSVEIANTSADPRDEVNQQLRTVMVQTIASLNLRTPSNPVQLPKVENNAVLLSAGTHTFGIEKEGTRFDGIPGATNEKDPCKFSTDVTQMYGIDFTGSVNIAANSCIIFTNCRFKGAITIDAGGRGQFVSCYFYGSSSVQNAGAAANAYIVGCLRKSGVAHVNVTIISEIT